MDARFADIPDTLWRRIAPLLPTEPPKPKEGRPRVPDCVVLAGIHSRLRPGCQWKALLAPFSSGSTCHLRFQPWCQAGVFPRVVAGLVHFYDQQRAIP